MKHRLTITLSAFLLVFLIVIFLTPDLAAHSGVIGQEMTLDYSGRYYTQATADHVLTALQVGPDRAIFAGTNMVLVELSALTPGGTSDYLDILKGPSHRNLTLNGDVVYSNLNATGAEGRWGVGVIQVVGDRLTYVRTIAERNVFYEKMDISGDTLFVAAHKDGIRLFDISNPLRPFLIGRLDTGFVDAFAIAVDGNTAYVADGGGGLKIVDVTDPTNPQLVAGEDLDSAQGTSEAVTVATNGDVFVAAGSSGVNVYRNGAIDARTLIDVGGMAEDFAWSGTHLLVTTYSGVVVLEPNGSGGATIVAKETSHRLGEDAALRLAAGIGSTDDGRILMANWGNVDVYDLIPASAGDQADINSSLQRIRFAPAGGSTTVTLSNNGQSNLNITGVSSTSPAFSVDYAGGTLSPGESVALQVNYDGSPDWGAGLILFSSNDPDENPLPIQVYGNTQNLDPGERAIDFTLPLLSQDPITGEWTETPFNLTQYQGKVVWLAIYGSW